MSDAKLEFRVEKERCKPLVMGLLTFARAEGGRREEALLSTFPAALRGREDVVRVIGLVGSRLGD